MSDSVSKILIEKCGVAFFLVVILALAIIAILHLALNSISTSLLKAAKNGTES